MSCPSPEQLENMVAGLVDDEAVREHLSACADCRLRADQIRDNNAFLAGVLNGSGEPAPAGTEIIQGYRILEEIHRGGQGIVYKAHQLSTNRMVAIKVLLEGPFASPMKRRRFEREIELAAALHHKNIVDVFDSGVTPDGRLYLVTEFVNGLSLDRVMTGETDEGPGAFDWNGRRVLQQFAVICDAVNHAHQRGVIHRDLKPGNILIDGAGQPRILDFGMARGATRETLDDGAPLTVTGEFMGTLAYASPEQLTGDPERVDIRTDVYSLGIILYMLVSGHPPYPTRGPVADVVKAISDSNPQPPCALRRKASAARRIVLPPGEGRDLDAIVLKALAKEPERRYQTAGELARDLRNFLSGHPVDARRDRTWYVIGKALHRHRLAVGVVALILVTMVASSVVSFVAWRRSTAAEELASDNAHRALQAATRAERLNDFLLGMFDSLDPNVAQGEEVLLREVLDAASRRLGGELAEDPEVHASLLITLGRTYLKLRDPHRARPLLQEAVHVCDGATVRRELLGEALTHLGICCRSLGDYDSAQQAFRRVGAVARELDPPHEVLLADSVQGLAEVAMARYELDDAIRMMEEAEGLLAEVHGTSSHDVYHHRMNRGMLLREAGKFDEADALFREVDQQFRAAGLERSTQRSSLLMYRASLAALLGETDVALGFVREAITLRTELLGPTHPWTLESLGELAVYLVHDGRSVPAEVQAALDDAAAHLEVSDDLVTAEILNDLGLLALARGNLAQAEEHFETALSIYDRVVGRKAIETAAVQHNLSLIHSSRWRLAEAEKGLRESLQRRQEILGEDHLDLQITLGQLAWVLACQSRPREAEPLVRKALEITRAHWPEQHPGVAMNQSILGLVLTQSGRPGEAEPILREARAHLADSLGEYHVMTLYCMHRLAGCLAALQERAEAEELFREVAELYAEEPRAGVAQAGRALNELGEMQYWAKDLDGALATFTEALELHRRARTTDPLGMILVLNNIGAVHLKGECHDQAEPYLREAVATARVNLPPDHQVRTNSLQNLAQVYEALEREEDCRALWQEVLEASGGADDLRDPLARKAAWQLVELHEEAGRGEEAQRLRERLEAPASQPGDGD